MQYIAECQGDNALQRVVFIVQYENNFSDEDFELFDRESSIWRENLPKRSVSNAVLVTPGSLKPYKDKIVGLSYESFMRDGNIEYGLGFNENRIIFLAGNYTQWKDIWPHAKKHLENAGKLVSTDNPVNS